MKVSVLIGSRDRPEALFRCLESVLKQSYDPLEILVLDDNSSQYRLDKLVRAEFQGARLRCFRSNKLLGVAGGRNFLMQKAEGDIFCVIDDDAYFSDNSCILHYVEAFECYPRIGIVAARIVDFGHSHIGLMVPFSQRWRKRRPYLTEQVQLVSYYLGTGHAIHRRVIEQCGRYQDDLMYGEEELDLSYRAIQAGFQILYLPSIVVHHHSAPSVISGQKNGRSSELYFHVRNRFFLAFKYIPWFYVPVYLTVWLTTYGLRALRQSAFGDFFGGIVAGIQIFKNVERTSLDDHAVQYLKDHYGRLWY